MNKKINKDNGIIKKYDDRKILAIGYYYCKRSNTYGKMIDSCKLAGYNQDHAKNRCRNILDLDRFIEADSLEWKKLGSNLIVINNILNKWFNKLNMDVPEINRNELIDLIRSKSDESVKIDDVKVLCNAILEGISTKDIRELTKLIRLIGDLQGKFIKREMKVKAKIEEKHIYLHFDNKDDKIKYYDELRSMANKELKELRG